MKRSIVILLGLSLLFSSCARLKKRVANPPAEQVSTAEEPAEEIVEEAPADPAPDFATMSFVEKNKLYLQLFDEKSSAGADTALAESTYQISVEASLNGDGTTADRALEEAILILWNL